MATSPLRDGGGQCSIGYPRDGAYAMDLRGCGETAPPPSGAAEEYSIPRLASDLAAFADRLDLPAFHLVGHSLGGAVALEFALRRAERVRSLALVAPAPPGGVATVRKGGSRFARILRGSIPATLRRWLPCARAT